MINAGLYYEKGQSVVDGVLKIEILDGLVTFPYVGFGFKRCKDGNCYSCGNKHIFDVVFQFYKHFGTSKAKIVQY